MKNLLNESNADRIIRVVVGLVLLYVGFGGVVAGTLGTILGIVGVVALVTGAIGWCPAYSLLKFSTKK
ncbi:MAG: DUF2892 domain-containing protein [Anaerolineales bacterium]|nr:DUF2892 domain-containing protein [Anaerolineales bacterium]